MNYTPPGPAHRARAYARDIARRIGRRAEPLRPSDFELRHLRQLRRAYGTRAGPEVLVIGDSIMYWTIKEPDRRRTFDMVTDELRSDVRCMTISGAGYNPRMVMAFLSALTACRSRPQVVVVPMTLCTAMSSFLDHPVRGQAQAAAAVRAAVAGWPDLPRRYEKAGDGAWAAADQRLLPSLIGVRRTMGELDLFINAASSSPTQRATRLRHLVDSYYGERLDPCSPGITLVAEMGTLLRSMDLRSVMHISPVDYQLAVKVLGPGARDHISHNAQVAESTFASATGELGLALNLAMASGSDEFSDPLHLKQAGRLRLARDIAEAVDTQLGVGRSPRPAPVALSH